MSTKTKTVILAAAALVMTAGASMAAPRHDHRGNGVNPYERAAIAQARAKVAAVKARAWRDGRLTFVERMQIKNAERQLAYTIARAKRT